jgi:hypothetical protein
MAEETKDAARVVPRFVAEVDEKEPEEPSDSLSSRAMVATALTNYGIGFSMIVVRRGSYDVGIDRHC